MVWPMGLLGLLGLLGLGCGGSTPPCARWYVDADADGFGAPGPSIISCEPLEGHSPEAGDCDDGDGLVHPGAIESCDGRDSDCDGLIPAIEHDADGDGVLACDDCDDGDGGVFPGATESCNARDDDCDGLIDDDDPDLGELSCGSCPAPGALDEARHERMTINPCVLDPTIGLCDPARDTHERGRRLHRISWRTDAVLRDELFLFLPPGPGDQNQNILTWATHAGYRVIGLGWNNAAIVQENATDPLQPDMHEEALYGIDTSPLIHVAPEDSALARLDMLMPHLIETTPQMGWDRYWSPSEGMRWDRVVLAGWSDGATASTVLARDFEVAGVVLISGPRAGDWVSEGSMTPSCRYQSIANSQERMYVLDVLSPALVGLGLGLDEVDIDTAVPPYDNVQRLTTAKFDFREPGCDYHAAMGNTMCMSDDLIVPYLHLFCTSPDRCTP